MSEIAERDERITSQLSDRVRGVPADGLPGEAMRAHGMFGPRVGFPADADDQTRVLGLPGRRA